MASIMLSRQVSVRAAAQLIPDTGGPALAVEEPTEAPHRVYGY